MIQEQSLGRALSGTGEEFDFSGTWKNELKSTVTFVQEDSVLSGTYNSRVSDDHAAATGTLQGYTDGNLISFVVHWTDFQAITSWVGQLESDNKTISTLWQMTKRVEPGDEWASINAGADYFIKLS